MNILCIDQNESDDKLKSLIDTLDLPWKIFIPSCIEEAYEILADIDIDFLIIDFSLDENKTFLDRVTLNNPKLKTITVSDNLSCSDAKGCEDCIKSYKRQRLLKPVILKELYETVANFDSLNCRYFKGFEDISMMLPSIVNQYYCYEFDQESNTLKNISENYNQTITQLLEIIGLLQKYDIKHEVLKDNSIKVY